jgi:hypothetical protein
MKNGIRNDFIIAIFPSISNDGASNGNWLPKKNSVQNVAIFNETFIPKGKRRRNR